MRVSGPKAVMVSKHSSRREEREERELLEEKEDPDLGRPLESDGDDE